ncbi:cyclic nucleotide-binding domain-containing protein [Velocimicrobium porci]|uniref:Cyclic nucleotide-binding domain-containing protein n=1 Tax=Velocimicrobium porci TaxID=2606634 RepID=A0A6L5XWB5_9FIRM|nr:hypothetical protein [Velocimicrobium porci]MSS63130.1 hypothetical protein [Velocimicrobium porci]
MGLELNMDSVNQIPKGAVIYKQTEMVESVSLVLKGRVLIERNGVRIVAGAGSFLGVCDLYSGNYEVTYRAVDDLTIYTFSANNPDHIENIFSAKKEYKSLMVISLSKYIKDLKAIETILINCATSAYRLLKVHYEQYKKIGMQRGYSVVELPEIEAFANMQLKNDVNTKKAEYYAECASLPMDIQRAFYCTNTICLYHVDEQAEMVCQLLDECSEISDYVKDLIELLYSDTSESLLNIIRNLIVNTRQDKDTDTSELVEAAENIVDKLKQIKAVMFKRAAVSLDLDEEKLDNIYELIVSGKPAEEENTASATQKVDIKELKDSLVKIVKYAELEGEEAEQFISLINQFRELNDKLSADDSVRNLRKQIAKNYYVIYEKVFLKAYKDKNVPFVVDLYLRYGLLDERLLTKEQLMELVNLPYYNDGQGPCHVYDMREWLTLIYEEKKMPSKSEFDMDYEQYVRSLKKTKEITEEQAGAMLSDRLKKLQYEIRNMFAYNNRVLSGQISTFVPFLHEDCFIGSMGQSLLCPDNVNAGVRRLEMIDFSIFCREVIYSNEEKGIKREFVIKKVYPDIILFPIAGSNAVMWQEFSGRKKDSRGRFFFPIFNMGKLDDNLIKLFGRFRWEVCRSTMGTAWNNIKYKSLTSEYMDYLQFYRKNRELTQEKKEKLKAQIQKGRNNSREVFVIDYEAWVKFESQGAIRLNKVARSILAMYCPFPKELREGLQNQPMFVAAFERYEREKILKVKELDLRERMLIKEGAEIPQILYDTITYYQES